MFTLAGYHVITDQNLTSLFGLALCQSFDESLTIVLSLTCILLFETCLFFLLLRETPLSELLDLLIKDTFCFHFCTFKHN